ncbi:hypothetical protein [Mycoplasma sp. 'Moose RK']|uniref:hypothetical protein n=1 Tax=Mycoplasma sp. 'Moose RK' TaxID=2780095 RepID=UPI001E33DDAE|nr:hypothetical protein [Mycoplasma sp. 'Moose RK']
MSKTGMFLITILSVIFGNIIFVGIVGATLYFVFKRQINGFQIDKITKTVTEIQNALNNLDSVQIKKFQEGLDKFVQLDVNGLKTQLDVLKGFDPTKLDEILKLVKAISPNKLAVATSVVSSSLIEFPVVWKLT